MKTYFYRSKMMLFSQNPFFKIFFLFVIFGFFANELYSAPIRTKRENKKTTKINPFGVTKCENLENFKQLKILSEVDFAKEEVYGYHKEEPEFMFENEINLCPIASNNNDEAIFKSLTQTSNKAFFSLESKKNQLYNKIHAPFGFDVDDSIPNHQQSFYNIRSYKSYFVFSATQEVETIVEKLKNVKWDSTFRSITKSDYQILKSSIIYIGAGQPRRPFQQVRQTGNILRADVTLDNQLVHWLLAKGILQKMFKKILVVPFFGSNAYTACVYSELATIWTFKNQTMNNKMGEMWRIKHTLCIDKNNPELYVKNCFSKQAMQFVADYNVDAGIRQIGKYGVLLDIATKMSSKRKKVQHLITRDTTLFYEFDNDFFKIDDQDDEPFEQDFLVTILPFKKIDFVFTTKDWVERVRLVNTIQLYLVSKKYN